MTDKHRFERVMGQFASMGTVPRHMAVELIEQYDTAIAEIAKFDELRAEDELSITLEPEPEPKGKRAKELKG